VSSALSHSVAAVCITAANDMQILDTFGNNFVLSLGHLDTRKNFDRLCVQTFSLV
jgi:hypothetical protein